MAQIQLFVNGGVASLNLLPHSFEQLMNYIRA